MFRLSKSGKKKKKTDAEAIQCGVCKELGMGILCGGCTLEPDPHHLTLPVRPPHCGCNVPVQEEGLAEATIIGIVNGNKMGSSCS